MHVRLASVEEQDCLELVFFFGLFFFFVLLFPLPLCFFLSLFLLFPSFFLCLLFFPFLPRLVDFLFFLFCPWAFTPLWIIPSASISRLSLWSLTLVLFSAIAPVSIDLYYKRKLTPILTHLRRRKQKGKGGEGRPLPWGEQAGNEGEVECFSVFSIKILIKFINKTIQISYTNR